MISIIKYMWILVNGVAHSFTHASWWFHYHKLNAHLKLHFVFTLSYNIDLETVFCNDPFCVKQNSVRYMQKYNKEGTDTFS